MNDLQRLLQTSSQGLPLISKQSEGGKRSKSTNSKKIDAIKLKRLRRDLIASKKHLIALDCDFAQAELDKDKDLHVKVVQKQETRELIQNYLLYGFDNNSFADQSTLPSLEKDDTASDVNQTIKKIVMNRKEQKGVIKEGNFSNFKVVDSKESANIKKLGTQSPNKETADPYSMKSIVKDESVLNLRSLSVNQHYENKKGVQRFFNFERERSKSKINQLLNKPIEIPSYLESSFITEGLSSKRKKELQSNESSSAANSLPQIINQSRNIESQMVYQTAPSQQRLLPIKSDYSNQSNQHKIRLFNDSNAITSRNISMNNIQSKQSILNPSENIRIAVTRPEEDEVSKLKFEFIKDSERGEDPRSQKLRKMASEVKNVKNTFKRQRVLFNLVEEAKDDVVGLGNNNEAEIQDPRKGSPLKSENPNCSVIKMVEPTYPLKSDFDFTELNKGITSQMHNQRTQFQINQIFQKKDLVTFSKLVPIENNFEISNIYYGRKMTEMNEILQMRMNQITEQCLNEDKIYSQFQKDLLKQTKIKGLKQFSDKRFSEFDTKIWPKMKNLRDYRNIRLSKTGYQVEEELINEDASSDQFKEEQPEIAPDFPDFQEYSNFMSGIRLQRHENCHKKTSGKIHNQLQEIKSKKHSVTKYSSDINNHRSSTQDLSEEEQKSKFHNRNQSINSNIPIQDDLSFTKTETKSPKFKSSPDNSPQSYQKILKKKKKEEKEKEREEELKRLADIEHAEYQAELQIIKAREFEENIQKFHHMKRLELKKISNIIEIEEQNQDDQFNIYENNIIANAQQSAKKRIAMQNIKEEKFREELSKSRSPIKITIIPTSPRLNNISYMNTGQNTPQYQKPSSFIQISNSRPEISTSIAKYDSPIQQKNTPLDISNQIPKHINLTVDSKRFEQKMKEKEDFSRLLSDVFNKNENIDYNKKMRKLKKKEKRLQELDEYGVVVSNQNDVMDEGLVGTDEGTDGDDTSNDNSNQNSDNERLEMQDIFQREELMELEMLKRKMADEKKANMFRKYLQMCKTEKVLPLPIISKINEGVLCLDDYKLNFGLCKALGNVLDDLDDSIFKIDLKNNGITDFDFAEVIKGAIKNPHIKSLSIKNNEFRDESLRELLKYFSLQTPILEELVISACKTKQSQLNELLRVMSDYTHLRTLAICQSKLDKTSVQYLSDIANANTFLRELDLSWNRTTSIQMWELVQNIEFCRNISFLNLSYNSFVGSHTNEIVESLCNFIKRNRKLQHLDISYCGLKKDEVFEVVKSCKKSRSLQAIHLTGNLITDETKIKIREFMQPRKRVKDIFDMINDPDEDDNSKVSFKIGNIDLSKAIQEKLNQIQQEQIDIKNNGNIPYEGLGKENQQEKGNQGETFILSRILGHLEIPRSHKWLESKDCWICDRHRYSVILVSKTIAETYFVSPLSKDRKVFIEKIKQSQEKQNQGDRHGENYGSDEDELYYDADSEEKKHDYWFNNQLCGTFNKWKPRSVLPLGEFIRRLRKNKEPPVKVVQINKDTYDHQIQEIRKKEIQKKLNKKKFKRMDGINSRDLKFDDESQTNWSDKITETDLENVKPTWLYEIQNIVPYKESANMIIPFTSILQLYGQFGSTMDLNEKYYAFADFLPPGKHNTCFLFNTINRPRKGLYTFLSNVNHRELPLDLNTKRVKEYRITRKFDKPTSMFKDFHEDNPAFLKKVFLKDIETWKLGRVIKDSLELRRLIDTMLLYIQQLKDVFNHCIALSSFPSISWIDFGNMCNQWKIPDNRTCTMQTIDRVFIATNVELVEQEDNPDRDLCRFEFYEIICRLGAAKYKDSGVVSTWDAAAKMIIEQNILAKTQLMGGQSFRDEYIWNLQIDDLFRANIENLQILHNKYAADQKLTLNLDRCFQMMESLQLQETELKLAYSFSKITISDEMNQKDRYDIMLLPELMDFICRCAHLKYSGMNNITFLEKVERVLDILFKQIEKRRERPNFEVEVSSDSNYDSDD